MLDDAGLLTAWTLAAPNDRNWRRLGERQDRRARCRSVESHSV